ncbi:MAG: hypothetical protein ABI679_00805 [Gemmatimonadota bacterium]
MSLSRVSMLGMVTVLAGSTIAFSHTGRGHRSTAACDAAEFRQFDFWLGDWDVFDMDAPSKPVARNKVTLALGNCVVREVYEQSDGLSGESFSIYDSSRRLWHQTWVTNRGTLLMLDGKLEGDRIVLGGNEKGNDGSVSEIRATWYVEDHGVREIAERTTDGGKSWKPLFDIMFRPHKGE